MTIDIQIATGSNVPIYRQITDRIRRGVASDELRLGDQLPSVRALAERLVINPNTVARAYNDLVRDGVLEARQGKGVFVANHRVMFTKTERKRRVEQSLDAFVNEAVCVGLSPDEIREAVEKKLEQYSAK